MPTTKQKTGRDILKWSIRKADVEVEVEAAILAGALPSIPVPPQIDLKAAIQANILNIIGDTKKQLPQPLKLARTIPILDLPDPHRVPTIEEASLGEIGGRKKIKQGIDAMLREFFYEKDLLHYQAMHINKNTPLDPQRGYYVAARLRTLSTHSPESLEFVSKQFKAFTNALRARYPKWTPTTPPRWVFSSGGGETHRLYIDLGFIIPLWVATEQVDRQPLESVSIKEKRRLERVKLRQMAREGKVSNLS
jgi:hypothetical protein